MAKKITKPKVSIKNKVMKVTKDMTFSKIMEMSPDAGMVLFKNGMHCIGCAMAMDETLEQGAWAHGLDPDKIALEINKEMEAKKK
jgi:hybrid cluster-associated redox disulfide protein